MTGPVSYQVKLGNGSILRRHKNQLRVRHASDKGTETFSNPIVDDDVDDVVLPSANDSQAPPTSQDRSPPASRIPIRRSTRSRHPPDRFGPWVS